MVTHSMGRAVDLELHTERREQILTSTKRVFARLGFHKAQRSVIAGEAGMSTGNLYRYFPSKEAMIAAFAEQDRFETFRDIEALAMAPDLIEGLLAMGTRYLTDQRGENFLVLLEIAAEICCNLALAELYRQIDGDSQAGLTTLISAAQERDEIDPDLHAAAISILPVALELGWRQAIDPDFDHDRLSDALSSLLRPFLKRPSK